MNSKVALLEQKKRGSDKWVKLICGASNEDIVAIEDYVLFIPLLELTILMLLLTNL